MAPTMIVHGGAGDIPNSRVQAKLAGVKKSVISGYEVLRNGGSALDAVEAAVVNMEEDDAFNAGFGSVLNIRGEVEMGAGIMSGRNLQVGVVTIVKDFLHPISIAHTVLKDSTNSVLAGEGVTLFAMAHNFVNVLPETLISEGARRSLRKSLSLEEVKLYEEGVGAVALDVNGHIATAASTGGGSGKDIGHIGGLPLVGSGTYADDFVGGVSAAGDGEAVLRYNLAHTIIKLMETGMDPKNATQRGVDAMTARLDKTAGAITLSKTGDAGIHFTSKRMSWAHVSDNKISYGIDPGQILEEAYP